MKTLLQLFAIVSLSILTASNGYAQQDGKNEVPIEQGPQPVSQNDWQVTFTPYVWLPSIALNLSVPTVTVGGHTIGGDFSVDEQWWDTVSKLGSDFYVLSLDARMEVWKGPW